MYFENIHALLEMNGHGVYVWSCYLVAVGIFAVFILNTHLQKKHALDEINVLIQNRSIKED